MSTTKCVLKEKLPRVMGQSWLQSVYLILTQFPDCNQRHQFGCKKLKKKRSRNLINQASKDSFILKISTKHQNSQRKTLKSVVFWLIPGCRVNVVKCLFIQTPFHPIRNGNLQQKLFILESKGFLINYSWFATTWQGGNVDNTIQFFFRRIFSKKRV